MCDIIPFSWKTSDLQIHNAMKHEFRILNVVLSQLTSLSIFLKTVLMSLKLSPMWFVHTISKDDNRMCP